LLWTAAGFGIRACFIIFRARHSGQVADIWEPVSIDTAHYAAEARDAGVYETEQDQLSDASHTGEHSAVEDDRK
jgi:stringent starvation protein B